MCCTTIKMALRHYLPEDIVSIIFEWDPTFRVLFRAPLHSIRHQKRIYDPTGSRLCIEYECDEKGVRHGMYKEYHWNQQPRLVGQYQNDRLTGTVHEYYDNGKLYREYILHQDCYVSLYREYYSNGNLLMLLYYDDQGQMQGPFHEYYANGNLLKRCWFHDGMPTGWCLMFFEIDPTTGYRTRSHDTSYYSFSKFGLRGFRSMEI